MFKDLSEAKALRISFVAGQRTEAEYRKGFDKMDRPNIMQFDHVVDVTISGKDVLPVQMNERGEYFFVVGGVRVENAADAAAIVNP